MQCYHDDAIDYADSSLQLPQYPLGALSKNMALVELDNQLLVHLSPSGSLGLSSPVKEQYSLIYYVWNGSSASRGTYFDSFETLVVYWASKVLAAVQILNIVQ